MDNAEKAAAWQDLLNADYNARYWAILTQHFHNRQRNAHIVLTISNSGAVVGWLSGFTNSLNFSISSVASFGATVVLPLLKWGDTATHAQGERRAWEVIFAEYNALWLELNDPKKGDPDAVRKELNRLRMKCAKQAGEKDVLPRIPRLEKKARKQVCLFWNIEDTAPLDFWDRLMRKKQDAASPQHGI